MIAKPTYDTPLKGYVEKVKHQDAIAALHANTAEFILLLESLSEEQWNFRYAEGKWSIKQMVQHISDTERIFGYRMIRLLRADSTPLPGYDENHFASAGMADDFAGSALLDEFKLLRAVTTWTFEHCNPNNLDFEGTANGKPVTARAIAFAMVGHIQHHIAILHERYGIV
jgi:hypothetical protein